MSGACPSNGGSAVGAVYDACRYYLDRLLCQQGSSCLENAFFRSLLNLHPDLTLATLSCLLQSRRTSRSPSGSWSCRHRRVGKPETWDSDRPGRPEGGRRRVVLSYGTRFHTGAF